MIFLSDQLKGFPIGAKIGITNLLDNITTRPGSHKGGWTRILKCQLNMLNKIRRMNFKEVTILKSGDKLSEFDIIIFDLGAEFKGTLNMFGGLNEKVFDRLAELNAFKGKFYSWKNDLPDLKVLESRRSNESTCQRFKESSVDFMNQVISNLSRTIKFDHVYKTESLLIGDSHTASVWDPSYMIERRDGRTLAGMVEHSTLSKYIKKYKTEGVEICNLMVHVGSIDIRHHLMREEKPDLKLALLLSELHNEISSWKFDKYTLVETMGIEDESRKLPKTGYFKGTPFCGNWNDRNELRRFYNFIISYQGLMDKRKDILRLPDYFFDSDGKLKFEVMELPQSVHISPEHYRTDLETGRIRWNNESQ